MFSRIKKQRLWLNFGDAINPLLNCENLIKWTTLFSLQFARSANQRLTLLNKTKNVGKRIFDKKRRQNVHLRKKHRQKYIWEKGLPHNTAGKVSVFGVFFCPYLPAFGQYLSVFSLNAGKYGQEELRIRTLFTQCNSLFGDEKLCVTDSKSVLEATIHFIISLDDSTHHSSNNSNGMRTHNHLVCKGTLNHLAKLGELSACRFESRCCHLNFRYRACFKQGVLWNSGNYRV